MGVDVACTNNMMVNIMLIEDTNVNMVRVEDVECISNASSGAANQSTSIVLLVVTAIFGNGTFGVRNHHWLLKHME